MGQLSLTAGDLRRGQNPWQLGAIILATKWRLLLRCSTCVWLFPPLLLSLTASLLVYVAHQAGVWFFFYLFIITVTFHEDKLCLMKVTAAVWGFGLELMTIKKNCNKNLLNQRFVCCFHQSDGIKDEKFVILTCIYDDMEYVTCSSNYLI